MNTQIQADSWIYRTVIALGLILVASAIGILVLGLIGQPIPDLLLVLGTMAATGLARLLTSPLRQDLLE